MQIGNAPAIILVKQQLEALKVKGLIKAWELPYEEIMTRLSAAVFFVTPTHEDALPEIWKELGKQYIIQYKENTEKKLSDLTWRVQLEHKTVQ